MTIEIQGVAFDEEDIQITWVDTDAIGKHGGDIHLSTISDYSQNEDDQVKYWATELRQAVDELLGAWQIFVRKQNPRNN